MAAVSIAFDHYTTVTYVGCYAMPLNLFINPAGVALPIKKWKKSTKKMGGCRDRMPAFRRDPEVAVDRWRRSASHLTTTPPCVIDMPYH